LVIRHGSTPERRIKKGCTMTASTGYVVACAVRGIYGRSVKSGKDDYEAYDDNGCCLYLQMYFPQKQSLNFAALFPLFRDANIFRLAITIPLAAMNPSLKHMHILDSIGSLKRTRRTGHNLLFIRLIPDEAASP